MSSLESTGIPFDVDLSNGAADSKMWSTCSIVLPEDFESSKATPVKKEELLSKQLDQICCISCIVRKPNLVRQKQVCMCLHKYLKIRNMPQFKEDWYLCSVPTNNKIDTCTLHPIHINCTRVVVLSLKMFLLSIILHMNCILNICVPISSKSMIVLYYPFNT